MISRCVLFTATVIWLNVQLLADPVYTVTAVTNPANDYLVVAANGINDSGQVTGVVGHIPTDVAGFLYSAGAMTFIGTVGGSTSVSAINNNSQIIGAESFRPASGQTSPTIVAFVYQSGTVTDIPQLNGVPAIPTAINNLGDIIGRTDSATPVSFLYTGGVLTDLSTQVHNGTVAAINDQRQIVGAFTPTGASGSHAFLYSLADGSFLDLGTLGGANSRATAINNSGQIVGVSDVAAGGGGHAFLYSGVVMNDLGTLGGDTVPAGINAAGEIVGTYGTTSSRHAFVYLGGSLRDLNDLLTAGSGWVLGSATGINASGQIVGAGSFNGQPAGYLLSAGTPGLSSLGGSLSGRPVIGTNGDSRLEVFARGPDNALYHAWETAPGGNWSAWQSLGGVIIGDPSVAIDSAFRLTVFVQGTDNAVWYRSQTSSGSSTWTDWATLGGYITSTPSVGRNQDARLDVLVRGSDNAVWEITQTSPGGSWGSWTSLGGYIAGRPVFGTDSDGRLELFALAPDNTLWNRSQSGPNGTWGFWQGLGGSLTGDVATARSGNGLLEVLGRGTDNALWLVSETSPAGPWSGFVSRGGVIIADPGAAVNIDGRVEAFVIGTDNAIWHISEVSPGGVWSDWSTLGGTFNSAPSAAINFSLDTLTVFATSIDGSVQYRTQTAPGVW